MPASRLAETPTFCTGARLRPRGPRLPGQRRALCRTPPSPLSMPRVEAAPWVPCWAEHFTISSGNSAPSAGGVPLSPLCLRYRSASLQRGSATISTSQGRTATTCIFLALGCRLWLILVASGWAELGSGALDSGL